MKNYRKIWVLIMGLILGLLATQVNITTPPARAAGPWYVGPGGNNSSACTSPATRCATINGALNKAGFVAGDTIRVQIGTYTGSGDEVVLLNKSATLSGGWNSAFTTQNGMSTIDGQGARRGVTVNSGVTATVTRFVVQNGFDTGNGGGGISNTSGNLTVSNSTIINNVSSYPNGGTRGGGIYTNGTLSIINSIITGNIGDFGGGGIYNSSGMVTITNSSIYGNTAGKIGYSGGDGGGGIGNHGTLIVNNSTVSSNTILGYHSGGGILNSGSLTLNSSTISGNTIPYGPLGGGFVSPGPVTVQNTIVAGNNITSGGNSDCISNLTTSLGYNLIGNTSGCTFTPTTGDLINIDPKLGPLEGSPAYHPLLPGSPAINAGNPAGCTDHLGNSLTTDQRGKPRFGRCDIGAYEVQAIEFSTKSVNQSTVSPGAAVTYTITLNNGGATNLTNVQVTDTLPPALTYINNSLNATSGSYGFNNGVISWNGTVNAGGAITITFAATINDTTPLGAVITNTAIISQGGSAINRSAVTIIGGGAPGAGVIYLPIILRSCPIQFADDFSNSGSGWPVADTGNVLYEYLNGEYHILMRSADWWAGARPGVKAADYTVAVDVRNSTGVFGSYGLLFGGSDDWSQFYTFEIYPDGVYEIYRYNSGWTFLTGGPSGSINPGTASNRLKIERRGSLIKAYANDQLLNSFSDGTFTGLRRVGVTASSYSQPNVDARFDNFSVCGNWAANTLSSEGETLSVAGEGTEATLPGYMTGGSNR